MNMKETIGTAAAVMSIVAGAIAVAVWLTNSEPDEPPPIEPRNVTVYPDSKKIYPQPIKKGDWQPQYQQSPYQGK